MGNPQVTGDALVYALELNARSLSFSVWQISQVCLPGYSRNGSLRLAQYAVYHDIERRLCKGDHHCQIQLISTLYSIGNG